MSSQQKDLVGITKRRRSIIVVLTLCLLLAGGITVFSIQAMKSDTPELNMGKKADTTSTRPYVTTDGDGELIVLDRSTGKGRKIRQDEKERLAAGLKQLINNSSDGLVEVQHSDGSVSMDLQGRFQNVTVAKRETDGSITQSCVNDLDAAAAFFEIDPALLGLAARRGTRAAAEQFPIK
jgi:hypothetical protein